MSELIMNTGEPLPFSDAQLEIIQEIVNAVKPYDIDYEVENDYEVSLYNGSVVMTRVACTKTVETIVGLRSEELFGFQVVLCWQTSGTYWEPPDVVERQLGVYQSLFTALTEVYLEEERERLGGIMEYVNHKIWQQEEQALMP